MNRRHTIPAALLLVSLASPVVAQQTASNSAAAPPAASQPDSLTVFFDTGSTTVRPKDAALLDQAAKLFRDGHPIVMIVTGSADTVGTPDVNLTISQRRAAGVIDALVARGIPAEHFQLVAKGETELAVKTGPNVAQSENRRAEITWR